MKKVLTVAVCKNAGAELSTHEDIEILYADGGEKPVYELLKQVKSKYTVLVDSDFICGEPEEFLKELDGQTADIITFDGGYLFKTSLLKGLPAKLCADRYSAEIFAAFEAKTVEEINLKPFTFSTVHTEYSEEIALSLSAILDEFKKSKAKLPKPVYQFIFDALLSRLVTFYLSAMVAIYRKEATAEEFIPFDKRLKDNIVLYLALEKRFTAADLKKLREKDFKISFLQYGKFKKMVKK